MEKLKNLKKKLDWRGMSEMERLAIWCCGKEVVSNLSTTISLLLIDFLYIAYLFNCTLSSFYFSTYLL